MKNKMKLYLNTIKYLKPSQICYRITNKIKRELYDRKLIKVQIPSDLKINDINNYLIPELDFDQKYLSRFDIQDILMNKFTFINITNQVDLSNDWNNKELQHLWRYNLHYFEYLFRLAYEFSTNKQDHYFKKLKEMIESWINNNPLPYGDGWHPYTISLRITNWISLYQAFRDRIKLDHIFDKKIRESIYLQYKYLQSNLEKDVLGNHYFENIKALIVGSIFFEDTKIKDKFKIELIKQLNEQILEDGMHFELSPMYHKIILEDLIKIVYWLKEDAIYNNLITYIQRMLDVTYSLEENFGKTPAFNDSTDGISKNAKSLVYVCKKYFYLEPKFKSSLEDSGFYIIKDSLKKLIFDTGDVCPSYLPAHAHCDALSFEFCVESVPVIVNSGTYRYENGKWRDYFRSTKAHNTVMVSDQEQSQYWSSFRVAERINKIRRKQFVYKDIQFYAGAYVTYHGVEHKRYIGHIDENMTIVLDYINKEFNNTTKSYLHFVPGTELKTHNNSVKAEIGNKLIRLTAIGAASIDIEKGWYSAQFNVKEENKVLAFKKKSDTKVFGYLINIGTNNYEIFESNFELKIISNKELIINYDELGDIL